MTDSISPNFIIQIIPHYRAALCCQICSCLHPIWETIITSQTKDICQMQRLLDGIGCNCMVISKNH